MAHYIYTRPCYLFNGEEQNRAILASFASEWDNSSQPKRYAENRLKMTRFEQMLEQLGKGDCVYVYNPAIFGIGIEACVENIRKVLAKGVRIRSVLFGDIDEAWAGQIQVAGEVVRECCEIEKTVEIEHNRGMRMETGGYFENGIWHKGQKKAYSVPVWSYSIGNRNTDWSVERRHSAAARWIEKKIMDAWTTERIWKEYQDLCKVLTEEEWERVSKQWINVRRIELNGGR